MSIKSKERSKRSYQTKQKKLSSRLIKCDLWRPYLWKFPDAILLVFLSYSAKFMYKISVVWTLDFCIFCQFFVTPNASITILSYHYFTLYKLPRRYLSVTVYTILTVLFWFPQLVLYISPRNYYYKMNSCDRFHTQPSSHNISCKLSSP